MPEVEIGIVTDFYAHPVVAAIDLTDSVKIGDTLHIKGHTTDLVVPVESLQIDHQAVTAAQAGQSVGLKVPERVRHGDHVYKVIQ
jgi:selenocysteine-specific translation elongation factor